MTSSTAWLHGAPVALEDSLQAVVGLLVGEGPAVRSTWWRLEAAQPEAVRRSGAVCAQLVQVWDALVEKLGSCGVR